ncbi:MAG: PTS sugar transporter subunit IIA [Planctomycetota bacterium]|nr:PTS sugar transporter subunit IIA [Planctomycetota bacterium]
MKLVDLFPKTRMLLELKARDKKGVIREMLGVLVAEGRLTEEDARKAERGIQKRELQGSTGIGKGIAIPHAKNNSFMDGVLGVFARSVDGVPFDSIDGERVNVVFLVLSSSDHAEQHLQIMKKVAMVHRDEKSLRFLAGHASSDSILEIFKEIDDGLNG